MFSFFKYFMGHTVKGQSPYKYRPSVTRRASGLSSIIEGRENALQHWNKLRKYVNAISRMQRNIRTKGFAKRGRFKVVNVSPKK